MQLHGLHHVTAVTANARGNLHFYTRVLGLRLVKKTVNQDDVSAYHLFYADKLGSPGTDMTFFDWPQTAQNRRGVDSISCTLFRVNGRAALDYWVERFESQQVKHGAIEDFAGREVLRFEDPEGQRLMLVDDQGAAVEGEPWDQTDIPLEHAIRGFYGIMLAIGDVRQLEPILTRVTHFEQVDTQPWLDNPNDTVYRFAMDGGGPGKEVFVVEQKQAPLAHLGRGGVHHVAFRLRDGEEQAEWLEHLNRIGVGNSGLVDRFYFQSVYFRISRGVLFELATDGPGFDADEPLDQLGERLALPPFLEPYRERIEAGLKPI